MFRLKFALIIVIFLFCFSTIGKTQQNEVEDFKSLVIRVGEDTIQLEEGYSYFYFTASDKYLAWYEGYTDQIYFQDLMTNRISRVEFDAGRGPYEINMIRGLQVIDNTLYVLDAKNSKIVEFDLDTHTFKNEILLEGERISFITSTENKIIGKGLSREGIFFQIDPANQSVTPIENTFDEEVATDFIKNPYRSDGPFIANDEFVLAFRNYETSVVKYNLIDHEFIDYFYDQTDIKTEYQVNQLGFASPPEKINLRLYDASFKPGTNIVYLIGNGKTKSIRFDPNTIYLFDIEENMYIGKIITELSDLRYICTNTQYIYAYDKERFMIRRLEIDS